MMDVLTVEKHYSEAIIKYETNEKVPTASAQLTLS